MYPSTLNFGNGQGSVMNLMPQPLYDGKTCRPHRPFDIIKEGKKNPVLLHNTM